MKRIVIKVGTAVLTTKENEIAKERMLNLVQLIAELRKNYDVILVSSGAAAAGYSALKLDKRKQIGKKALAAAGQPILMHSYKDKFDFYDIDTAQILLTEDDFDSRKRTLMFQEIINAHLANDIMPIINENDITSTPDQIFDDNDLLSAMVAIATEADLLVIISDIYGYYDKNPHEHADAKRYDVLYDIPDKALQQRSIPNDPFAKGGIVTKLQAAKFLVGKGKRMFLCSGFDLTGAEDFLLNGKQTSGTLFEPKPPSEK